MRTQVSSSTISTKQILSDVLSLTKPRLSGLVIITTAGGMWLAGGTGNLLNGLLVLLGTAMVVGAANTFNCYIERDIDARMMRTANRPLPAGRLDPKIALYFGRLLVFGGLPLVTLWGNPLTGLLAALALLSYVMIYTPMKPRSSASTLIGAFPGALPPLMGWTAVTGRLELPGFILFAILFLWQIPHFLAIALMRQDEYAAAGLKVLPKTAGEKATKRQIFIFTLILLPVSLTLVPMGVMGSIYLVGASILGCGFLWVAVQGFGKNVGYPWARKLFLSSLVYLTLLIAFLILDVLFVGLG